MGWLPICRYVHILHGAEKNCKQLSVLDKISLKRKTAENHDTHFGSDVEYFCY